MQSINQLTAKITNNLSNQMSKSTATNSWQSMTHFTARQANPQAVKVLAEMFTIWKSQYKTKMKEGAWDLLTAQIWAVALADMNMTQDEYYVSYRKSLSLEWLPTTPYDFLMLAREEIIKQYPDSFTAFKFACENEGMTADIKKPYSHVVIYETVKRIGSFTLKQADDRFFSNWDKVYQAVIKEHEQGADFTIPQSNRVEHKHFAADDNVAQNHLQNIKAMLAGKAGAA